MIQRFASDFYSYRISVLPRSRIVADPSTRLEYRIRSHILNGNAMMQQEAYAAAIEDYLAAWRLLPRLVVVDFPDWAGTVLAEALLKVDMVPALAATSVALWRYGEGLPPEIVGLPSVDPPDDLLEIAQGVGFKPDAARQQYEIGQAELARGDFERAQAAMENAAELGGRDRELQADASAALGVIALRQGNADEANQQMTKALDQFRSLGDIEGVAAAERNMAAINTFLGESRTTAATMSAGRQPVLTPLVTKDWELGWTQADTAAGRRRAVPRSGQAIAGGKVIAFELDDEAQSLIAEVYEPRIMAEALADITPSIQIAPQFVTYLAHVGGYVLPLALGDAYAAFGDFGRAESYYLKARDYRFLNRAIERPAVWAKLARLYVTEANRLYRDRKDAEARTLYERILIIEQNGFSFAGPLYSGGFAGVDAQILPLLQAGNRRDHVIDYKRKIIVLEAETNLRQILAGINYLGFPSDIIPIHHWRYLQNVARYMAQHASQTERAYITFKDRAEQESFTKLTLEQAVDAQAAALDVEEARIEAANAQKDAAEASRALAQQRLTNAQNQKADYEAIAEELIKLEEINGWATGPMDRAEIGQSYADVLGIAPGTYDTYQITRIVARRRAQINSAYELANMDRRIAEAQAGLASAQAQVDVADAMVEVAEAQKALSEIRLDQAQAQLEFFDAQEFTPELWTALADAQRELSARYLDWAIGAAFLMERAYEVEFDLDVNRIRFDYTRSDLNGLFAADYLLADIDHFTYDRIVQTDKQLPVKTAISLNETYPIQFQREFKATGRMDFEVLLETLDRLQPGAHLRKLKRVEVVIEGLLPPAGVHGRLTHAGVSNYRDRTGARKQRVQRPETMLLSRYDLRQDGFVFSTTEDLLEVFENLGAAAGYILEFPPDANDLDFRDITDVHLVLYYDCYYSDTVRAAVAADLAANAINEHTLGLGLRFQYPDAFFGFQDDGQIAFTVDAAFLPFNHTSPTILEAHLLVETDPGVSNAGLTVELSNATGASIAAQTDANGMLISGAAGAPLNPLRTMSVLDDWTVRLPAAQNAGLDRATVRNVFFYLDYGYTPRTQP